MGQTAITIRMDSDLKSQFDKLCNEFGMSVNTAMNIFARTVVRTQSIPFPIEKVSQSKEEKLRLSKIAFEQLRKEAKENGLASMTLEDINEEIKAVRHGR